MTERYESHDPQLAVIHLSQRIGGQLANQQRARLRALLLDVSKTYDMIADELIPESVAISIGTARAIIWNAARQVLTNGEYRQNVSQRLSRSAIQNAPLYGFGTGDSLRKSIEARGEIPWSDEERALLLELIATPEFQYPPGSSSAGKPNYSLIMSFINSIIHDEVPVRTLRTLRAMRSFFLDKEMPNRSKQRQIMWSDDETQRLKELATTCFRNNDTKRGADFTLIAQTLNQEFHSDELEAGVSIRRPRDCFKRLEYLGTDRVKQKRFPWSDEEERRLEELCRICVHEDGGAKGEPRYAVIAEQLNREFHAVALEQGTITRTASTCCAKMNNIRGIRKKQGETHAAGSNPVT